MGGSAAMRLVAAALRCYPRRWRDRHGEEAAELATQLMRDGVTARSIAWSYARGAARERLAPGPQRRLGAAAGTLLAVAVSLGAPLALCWSSAPASATSVIRARITDRGDAAAQLASLLRSRHVRVTVTQEPVSPSLVGSIITTGGGGFATGGGGILGEIIGRCAGGALGCVDGVVLPAHFTGSARIVVGRAARPGERYAAAAGIFRPGEALYCSGLLGQSVQRALPALRSLHVTIAWDTGGGKASRGPAPPGRYYVTGGTALSATAISIRLTASQQVRDSPAARHGQRC